MPNYANDDDKSLTFRPHFDDKVIKKCQMFKTAIGRRWGPDPKLQ